MGTTVEELRAQHKLCCDRIVDRLETKSSRGEGPNRVLRRIMRHFDKSDGMLLLTGDEFVMAMERIGTKLSPSDLDLLLTIYAVDGGGFDGQRFAADLFGDGGHSSSMIRDSGIQGGVFTQDHTPREGPDTHRRKQHANDPSQPGGIFGGGDGGAAAPHAKKTSNTPSQPGGIFGNQELATAPGKRTGGGRTNQSSIPGGIFG
mmetsp:Transcript_27861/g.75066  ORF Transcript_27861/g.75066 Transcript_27861/m.75066 type:complete len:203 (-) Transcript_27861:544-1152(-)|eukprot:CAMPEP_0185190648 /NCGR_PEP_ID=MMETSP1140-20130426/11081_1 /TAXON_ID=298111 /ORGANISM="Pavlova sp., Strain CCMP459" /LENGTH=202 /DNA_ID=CAMNT_0027757311 /DNA_START=55 /DNA_END=663 /DNA_ORIENTATION=-